MTASVLLVEDDEDTREIIACILAADGYQVTTAANGLKALEYLRGTVTLPALILLDMVMPEMNGWQFRAEQEREQRLADIPVVAVSASHEAEKRVMGTGMTGYLRKPFELDGLLAMVARHSRPSHL